MVAGGLQPRLADAATNDPMILGSNNAANAATTVSNPSLIAPDTVVYLASAAAAVRGFNRTSGGHGVRGETSGDSTQIAVLGTTTIANGEGIGVRGVTRNGIALQGEALEPGGYGLEVKGRAVFNRSGKTTIAAGDSTKTISTNPITAASIVVATVQGNPAGVWVRSVAVSDPNNNFTIRLNKAAPAGGVVVGYFVVN